MHLLILKRLSETPQDGPKQHRT
ncbi:hypothetical protein BOS5A_110524 [Bosea sp. EC-HK365B]|nr:hypothetical protein BOSE46_110144 [Bosea sp. 46]CAD5258243.1 hypothetical protein BOSE21B_110186 [Bosea sp. 21B]VVT52010.1 hypothetical protein BOS5A_110524 [Bosea sp. EC-HK365B]VXB83805.1 hypothetical protein BOSE125_150292 [Bosea sp. 125]